MIQENRIPVMTTRIIPFQAKANFRQLGGYPAQDGRLIRYGILYRSAALDLLQTPKDRERLRALGLKTILDLRSQKECDDRPDPDVPGATYLRRCAAYYPDGRELDLSSYGIIEFQKEMEQSAKQNGKAADFKLSLRSLSKEMPFDNEAFRTLFHLLENGELPLLFHCSEGKDRTGLASILVLMALGVSRKDALDDYELTNLCYDTASQKVKRRNAEYILDSITDRYGNMEHYFAYEFDLKGQRLLNLQKRLLNNNLP